MDYMTVWQMENLWALTAVDELELRKGGCEDAKKVDEWAVC